MQQQVNIVRTINAADVQQVVMCALISDTLTEGIKGLAQELVGGIL